GGALGSRRADPPPCQRKASALVRVRTSAAESESAEGGGRAAVPVSVEQSAEHGTLLRVAAIIRKTRTAGESGSPGGVAVLFCADRKDLSGRRRAALPGGVSGGVYRQRLVCPPERSYGAGVAEERMRGGRAGRAELLRGAARTFRVARRGAKTGSAEYRRGGRQRFRR